MAETLYKGRFLKLVKNDEDPGKGWEFVQRTTGKAIVAVLAVTKDQKILLVEQYRPPVGQFVVELPAGITGDTPTKETLEATARRELLEETGYEAGALEPLLSSPASSGLTDENINVYLAFELKKVGKGGGVKGENITVHEVELAKLFDFIKFKKVTGTLIDYKIYAALYMRDQR